MPSDPREFITVHNGMPEHWKIEALSDKAFRVLVDLWCWCSRTRSDGFVPEHVWIKRTRSDKVRRELLSSKLPGCNSLASCTEGGVMMHDYLEHQLSSEQITQSTLKKSSAGTKGAHKRWHSADKPDSKCIHCQRSGWQVPSQVPSQESWQDPWQNQWQTDGKTWLEEEVRSKDITHLGSKRASKPTRESKIAALNQAAHSHESHKLVEAFASRCQRRPPSATINKLAVQVDSLLTEGWPPEDIARSLTAWGDKGLSPSLLPDVAHEVVNARPVRRGRPTKSDKIKALGVRITDEPKPEIEE